MCSLSPLGPGSWIQSAAQESPGCTLKPTETLAAFRIAFSIFFQKAQLAPKTSKRSSPNPRPPPTPRDCSPGCTTLIKKPPGRIPLTWFIFIYSQSPTDVCLIVMPPCMGDADRFSLEALRHIHKQLDDDNDGGIEVNESVEVSAAVSRPADWHVSLTTFLPLALRMHSVSNMDNVAGQCLKLSKKQQQSFRFLTLNFFRLI